MKFKKIELLKIPFFNFLLVGGSGLLVMLINFFGLSSALSSFYGPLLAILLPLLLFAVIVIDNRIEKNNIQEYGFQFKPSQLRIAFYSFLALFPVAFISRVFTPGYDVWYSSSLPFSELSGLINFIAFYIPLGVIAEEFGERALFQSRLSKLFGSRAAVYTVTLNFLLLHLATLLSGRLEYQLMTFVTLLLYSLVLCIFFEYTKSVYATLLLHFLINLVSSIQIFLHIRSLFAYEAALWLLWAALLLLNLRSILKMLTQVKFLKEVRLPSQYGFYLFILAIPYPIFIVLSQNTQIEFILPAILLLCIAAYYIRSFIVGNS